MSLCDDLGDACRRDVPLGPLTWFQLGGPAEFLIEPRSDDQLATVLHRCRETGTPVRVLGLGANVLVSDEGVRGVVLRLTADAFCRTTIDGTLVTAGAGVSLVRLALRTVRRGLAGLEVLAGIPASVGGGIRMNCGGRYGDIAASVRSVRVIRPDGRIEERPREDMGFGYRRCDLRRREAAGRRPTAEGGCPPYSREDIILGAAFDLTPTDPDALYRRFREIWDYKHASQPALSAPSAGCIFRNPEGRFAGELIDSAGLKGHRIGCAVVSDRHANFITADPPGRAADVRALIEHVRRRVLDVHGVVLEPEVQIW